MTTIPIIELDARKPRLCGQQHGRQLKGQIHEMAAIRMELAQREMGVSDSQVLLDLAHQHLPVLQRFDADLYEELVGISEGSGSSLEALVILNNYTDFRDIVVSGAMNSHDPGGCSVMYIPPPEGPILGQTWDTHGSATDYLVLLEIQQAESSVTVLSIAGCLGMMGMSSTPLAVTINNLTSTDGRVGVVWSAVVRKLLRQTSASKARDILLKAELGSGHHYVIVDQHHLYAIETSGTQKKIIQADPKHVHIHTNHCLDADIAKHSTIKALSTTHQRFEELEHIVQDALPHSAASLDAAFNRVWIDRDPKQPHATATCASMVMDLRHNRTLSRSAND